VRKAGSSKCNSQTLRDTVDELNLVVHLLAPSPVSEGGGPYPNNLRPEQEEGGLLLISGQNEIPPLRSVCTGYWNFLEMITFDDINT